MLLAQPPSHHLILTHLPPKPLRLRFLPRTLTLARNTNNNNQTLETNGDDDNTKTNPKPLPGLGFGLGLRWRDLLDPDPENIVAVGLTGLLALASLQALWQLFFISAAILVAALNIRSVIAAVLLQTKLFAIYSLMVPWHMSPSKAS